MELRGVPKKKGAPFGGRWAQPKKGPWVSIAIVGEYDADDAGHRKQFGGVFPLRAAQRIKVITKGHQPWKKWATKRWGETPYTITAYWHDGPGSKSQVLWSWDAWDGFRDTAILRGMQRQSMQREGLDENGDMIAHVVDMAKKHGIKGEGPRGKFTKEQVRKLAAMREGLGEVVDVL